MPEIACRGFRDSFPCMLATLSAIGFFLGGIETGLVPAAIPTLEKEFDLRSAYSGLLVSLYEVAFIIAALLVGHFCKPGSVLPRWIAAGCTSIALGAGCLALAPGYWLLAIGQVLIGVGATPLWVLGPAYLEINCTALRLPRYLGVLFGINPLGVAAGYVVGGVMATASWRLPFFVFAAPLVPCAVLMGSFPQKFARLAGASPEETGEEMTDVQEIGNLPEEEQQEANPLEQYSALTGYLTQSPRLFRTPAWSSLVFGNLFSSLAVTAFSSFLPKFLEVKHGLSHDLAPTLVGICVVPGAAVGVFVGGCLATRLRWDVRKQFVYSASTTLVTAGLTFMFLLPWLAPMLIMLVIGMFLGLFNSAPVVALMVLVVPAELKALSMGLNNILSRVGSIIGPPILGGLIDTKMPISLAFLLLGCCAFGAAGGMWLIGACVYRTHAPCLQPLQPLALAPAADVASLPSPTVTTPRREISFRSGSQYEKISGNESLGVVSLESQDAHTQPRAQWTHPAVPVPNNDTQESSCLPIRVNPRIMPEASPTATAATRERPLFPVDVSVSFSSELE
eukprot:TRINITY_DN93215_c0_g1_i2.p1 TRINITY_DN93215_c0_g1~~TRINITY_DN93215_c0_g1_i2.p1  ORF type:complete len:564 (+),score=62.48 TRINITY_DN93215_c0_g1_i2:188-1879(+)